MTSQHDQPITLRADAARNRQRIVKAARQVFEREGVEASMASVAREAEVGIATLFRHFPEKDDLIAAALADRMDDYARIATEALSDADPWNGFVYFVEQSVQMQVVNSGFADIVTMAFPRMHALDAGRQQAYESFVLLIDRAKGAGRLRADFTPEDLVLLHMAMAGVISATASAAPDAWRRVLALLIQSYSASNTQELPPAPTPAAIYRSMLRREYHGNEKSTIDTSGIYSQS